MARLRADDLQILIDAIYDLERFVAYGVESVSVRAIVGPMVWLESTTFWRLFPDVGWDQSTENDDGSITWTQEYAGITFFTRVELEPSSHSEAGWY